MTCMLAKSLVQAADRLRLLHDGARLGFSGQRDGRPVNDFRIYRPPTGPTPPALKQLRCRVGFDRAWSLFGDEDRATLAAVILGNVAMARYAEQSGLRVNLVKERLVAALDRLVDWFDLAPPRRAA